MMSRYLVTGAAGFLGAHLTRLLSSRGDQVLAVDNGLHANAREQFTRLESLDGVEVLHADLTDSEAVRSLPEVTGVYHLAALNGTQNDSDSRTSRPLLPPQPRFLLLRRLVRGVRQHGDKIRLAGSD